MKHYLMSTALLFSVASVYGDYKAKEKIAEEEISEKAHLSSSVYTKSPNYSFEVNFTALVMQPSASNLDYAAQANPFDFSVPVPVVSPNWVIHEISPDYHFGFDLGIGGILHDLDATISLNWERFHSPTDSNSKSVVSTSMIGPFFEIGPDASFYKKSKGSVKFHFDAVNFDYGTFVHFGKHLRMNLFVGAGFARIVQHRFTTFSNFAGTIVRTLNVPAEFIGAGPQFGLNFVCRITNGFQFIGDSRATLFVGRLKNKTTFSSTAPALDVIGGPNPNVQTTSVDNRTGLVPGFEGRLGFAYEFEASHYMFKLEAGYRAQIYLNALRSIDMGSEVALDAVGVGITGDMGVYARTFDRTISDFALTGPYFTFAMGF